MPCARHSLVARSCPRRLRYTVLRLGCAVRGNLLIAPVAIGVNFVVSLPGAIKGLFDGTTNSRVPATILIAIGAILPAITSGLNRFGDTSAFFLGELLGVVFLFLGFLVSIEVFAELRVPFTGHTLWQRRTKDAS